MIPLHWHTEPILIASLLFAGWLYIVATGPLRYRWAPKEAWPGRQTALYLAGLTLAYLTVGSPLDQLGEDFLFSAHMVQHTLLIYAIPVLLLFGIPPWVIDPVFRNQWLRVTARTLVHPITAGVLFTLCFSIWHIPELYEAALQSKRIHIFEHITMFATAVLMWWPIISPSRLVPARSYGFRILYICVLMVGQLPLFGFLTFSREVLYPTYDFAPRLAFLDLTPLEDQTLGGVIMKIANMIVSLLVFGISFYYWVKASEKAAP